MIKCLSVSSGTDMDEKMDQKFEDWVNKMNESGDGVVIDNTAISSNRYRFTVIITYETYKL